MTIFILRRKVGWTEEEEEEEEAREEEDITYWISQESQAREMEKGKDRSVSNANWGEQRRRGRRREEEKERDGCLVSVSGKVVPECL